ncbi:hypothetical protein ABZY42_18500 [Streptomyces sp. NPDC006622]|uniref:hypothetical protein n=1 Tax=Streptomyces sp. NPDC006622 TaxID=3155459 RepID=UPI0033B908D9
MATKGTVRRYPLADTSSDHALDRRVSLAAGMLGTPMAGMAVVDTDRVRVRFRAARGLPHGTEAERLPGLSASAVLRAGAHLIADAVTDARTAEHPLVRGEPGTRCDATAPIATVDGQRRAPSTRWTPALASLPIAGSARHGGGSDGAKATRRLTALGTPSTDHLPQTVDDLLDSLGPGIGNANTALLALSVSVRVPSASPHQENR